jgi:hypothetical protein
MKTPPIALMNKQGFVNNAQKVYFAASLLSIGCNPQSPTIFPAVAGDPLSPVFTLPVIAPTLPFAGTCSVGIDTESGSTLVKAKIPYNHARVIINDGLETFKDFKEFTLPTLQITRWGQSSCSNVPETKSQSDVPATLEAFLAVYAFNVMYNIEQNGTVKAKSMSFMKQSTILDPKTGISIPIYDIQLLLAGNQYINGVAMYQ